MPRLSLMTATFGSEKYFFQGSASAYDSIVAAATGIAAAEDTDQDEAPHRVGELTRSGIIKRIAVSVRVGTSLRSKRLFCAVDKLRTVLDSATGLKGKTAFGGTITSVRIPRKSSTF
jgi:hypothetical protein